MIANLLLMAAAAGSAASTKPVLPMAEDSPLVEAYDRCLVAAARGVPAGAEARSRLVAKAEADCRATLRTRMDSGEFADVGKAGSARRTRSEGVLDYVDARFEPMIMNMPDPAQVKARIAAMGIGVRVYEPVVAQQGRYANCVTTAFQAGDLPGANSAPARVKAWRDAIRACRGLKAAMMTESESILARRPDFQDPERRRRAISGMFDGYDRMMLKMAETDWTGPQMSEGSR